MLRVTVELVPGGREDAARKIAEMVIGNIGTSSDGEGHKYAWLSHEPKPLVKCKTTKQGILDNYYRAASVWSIIAACLTAHSKKNKTKRERQSLILCRTKMKLFEGAEI